MKEKRFPKKFKIKIGLITHIVAPNTESRNHQLDLYASYHNDLASLESSLTEKGLKYLLPANIETF